MVFWIVFMVVVFIVFVVVGFCDRMNVVYVDLFIVFLGWLMIFRS